MGHIRFKLRSFDEFFFQKVEKTLEKFRSEKGKKYERKMMKEKIKQQNSYPAKFRLVPNYYKLCENYNYDYNIYNMTMCTSKNNDSQDYDKRKKEKKKSGFLAREEKKNP